jgi:hypothetical protein
MRKPSLFSRFMYVIFKHGFYLYHCNPHADLWVEKRAIAHVKNTAIAQQYVEFVGGEVVEVSDCLVR